MTKEEKIKFAEQWTKLVSNGEINILWADGSYTTEHNRPMIVDSFDNLVLISTPEENGV